MRPPAWMVELVDTTDLKSVDPKGRAGSSPAPGTKREIAAMRSLVFFHPLGRLETGLLRPIIKLDDFLGAIRCRYGLFSVY